jgi:histidinol-phosphate aminotransferase
LVAKVLEQKQILKNELSKFSFVKNIIESDANFYLLEVIDADAICSYLLKYNILISNRTSLLNCKNHIRISVGTEIENKKLIELLKKYN